MSPERERTARTRAPTGRALMLAGLVALARLAACDGDGCAGGPGGAATQFCQEQLGRGTLSPAELAEACRGCCLQEVPYVGRVEGGRCVCRR